jgi:hypothetical protein
MSYSKPAVLQVASSLLAIRFPTVKFVLWFVDGPIHLCATINAYAADE